MLIPRDWHTPPDPGAEPAVFERTAPAPFASDRLSPAQLAPTHEKLARPAFCWPTPPYASYPVATPQTDPLPCRIVGLNDKSTDGRLTFFVPEEGVAHVQLPPARTTLALAVRNHEQRSGPASPARRLRSTRGQAPLRRRSTSTRFRVQTSHRTPSAPMPTGRPALPTRERMRITIGPSSTVRSSTTTAPASPSAPIRTQAPFISA